MTFRLGFGASYSTIVFTVKSLLIYEVEWNPQSPTTITDIYIQGGPEKTTGTGYFPQCGCNNWYQCMG